MGGRVQPFDLSLGLHRQLFSHQSRGCGHVSADEYSFEQSIPGYIKNCLLGLFLFGDIRICIRFSQQNCCVTLLHHREEV